MNLAGSTITLAADVGGTFTRLACLQNAEKTRTEHRENHHFESLEALLLDINASLNIEAQHVQHLLLALPAPVQEEFIQLTNINWKVHRATLQQVFPLATIHLINDFQAAASGALIQPPEQLLTLNQGLYQAHDVAVVTGPGTGLGMAWRAAEQSWPRASEAGHVDFSPRNEWHSELHQQLRNQFGQVCWEHLLSGAGLTRLHAFLQAKDAATSSQEVVQRALQQEDAAERAIREFWDLLAAWCAQLALQFTPHAGIYIAGGLASRLLTWLNPETFNATYTENAQMQRVIESIPLYLVKHSETGLDGVTHLAQQLHKADL